MCIVTTSRTANNNIITTFVASEFSLISNFMSLHSILFDRPNKALSLNGGNVERAHSPRK